ncbi:MAG: hypothetical protein H0V43_09635 [Gemmatimonadales bacterium]|nr:hypothetical protein [Gemmatimonadales bacterium]
MRIPMGAGLAVASLVVAACGGGGRPVEINPREQMVGTRWNATLATPAELVGATEVRGTGWMGAADRDSSRTRAQVSILNAVPGGEHPWHVHVGRCGNDQGILGPPEAYDPLTVGGNGQAESTAELPVPVPSSGQYFINVHASANNMGTIVACGNLAPPSR